MLGKLALLLKSKLALAVVGTVLVAGGGTTVALASTGAHVPLVSPAHSQQQQQHANDASDDHGGLQQNDNQADNENEANENEANENEANENEANENELQGIIGSITTADSSFVLQVAGGGTKTVVVSAQTVFDGGPRAFSDLKTGMSVEVRGNLQSNGTLAALRIHGEDDAGGDRGSAGSDGSGNSGTSGSGQGGHDDGRGDS